MDGASWHDGHAVGQRGEADARMVKPLVLALGVAAVLGSVTLHAADSCSLAKAKLEEYLIQLPQACSKITDCDGYYYRANPCSPAVVLAKPGVTKSSEPRLFMLQGNVRQACAAEFSEHAVCSPIPYRAVCRKARCVDAVSAPDAATLTTPPLPSAPHHFRYATVVQTCAPWDGPALAVMLSDTADCAPVKASYIQISLWRDLPPTAGKTFSFDIRNSNGQASRCLKPNECEAATSGSVVFDIVEEGKKAKGRYELHFKDDSIESGSFEAEWCENRALCG
jgi:hypothetical protein